MLAVVAQRIVASWVAKAIVGGLAVLSTFRFGAGIYFWRVTEKLERPSYTVIQRLTDGVELRRYEPYLIAETTVDGQGFREPTREGFQACAGYIFGKNKPRNRRGGESEKMAMTAPVRIEGEAVVNGETMAMTAPVRVDGGANKKTKVSFVMGREYSLKTLPTPINKNVKLRQVPSHTLAVRSFSGPPPKDDRVALERERVDAALAKANLKPNRDDTVMVYGYHDPFITPNFLRRNEVALVVEGNP